MALARTSKKKESARGVTRKKTYKATKICTGSKPVKVVRKAVPVSSKVVIKYDVGFPNQIYIRGNGPGMSWEKGVAMRNVGPDEWVWETSQPFSECEFKVLVNDYSFEEGENHRLSKGESVQYTPHF